MSFILEDTNMAADIFSGVCAIRWAMVGQDTTRQGAWETKCEEGCP